MPDRVLLYPPQGFAFVQDEDGILNIVSATTGRAATDSFPMRYYAVEEDGELYPRERTPLWKLWRKRFRQRWSLLGRQGHHGCDRCRRNLATHKIHFPPNLCERVCAACLRDYPPDDLRQTEAIGELGYWHRPFEQMRDWGPVRPFV